MILLFNITILNSYSQKLTINQLITICNKSNWESVNQYIQNRGWDYFESEKGDSEKYNTITWSYQKNYYDDKAKGWFHLYTYEGFPNKVIYNVFNKPSYNIIKNNLSSKGFKLTDKKIEDNEITTTYSNNSFILKIITGKNVNKDSYYDAAVISYSFILIKKEGIYDDENGKKYSYFPFSDKIESEYYLENGKLHGKFKVFYKNGNLKRVGNYTNGKENGSFKEFNEEGLLEAEYNMKNGSLEGTFTVYSNGKKIKQLEYVNDILSGTYEGYFYNDEGVFFLIERGMYKNGEKDGNWTLSIIEEENKERILSSTKYINGIKNGEFQEVKGDSLIIGFYKDDKLSGKYKVYIDLMRFLVGGVIRTDTTNMLLITKGSYYDDLKFGQWIYYDLTGTIRTKGAYKNNNKSGVWYYYYSSYFEGNEKLPYSGKLYLTETYKDGKLNGKSERFSSIEKVQIPCNENSENDTCFQNVFIKDYELLNYKNDTLNGLYLLKDSTGFVLKKGNYINGIKDGFWINNSYKNSNGSIESIEGKYLMGKKVGEWNVYLLVHNDKIRFYTQNYKNGLLDGKCIVWHSGNQINKYAIYKDGEMIDYVAMNTLFNTPELEIQIIENEKHKLKCNYILFQVNSDFIKKEEQIYTVNKDTFEIDEFNIESYISERINSMNGNNIVYPNGIYKLYEKDGKLFESGIKFKTKKIGLWKYMYYNQNVRKEIEYDHSPIIEKYYILNTGELFNGKFTLKNDDSDLTEIIKIKDGLRNGMTKFYNSDKKLIRKVKYKEGLRD